MQTVFAIDIGGTQIKTARVSTEGAILDSQKSPTPATLAEFHALAAELTARFGDGATAVGIGCKGIIDPATTRIERLPGTIHYLEKQILSELFAVPEAPVFADNDARVALVGERRWGAARAHTEVIMLTLGTGIGGGVISGGRLIRGTIGAGGHLGHYTIDAAGIPCICGNRGCIETIFSSRAIEAAAFSAIHRGVKTSLSGSPTCEEIFDAARSGDSIAGGIVKDATLALGAAIAGMSVIFDPQIIILGGQIVQAGDLLLDPLREEVWKRTSVMLGRSVPIVRSELADPSGVLGAAALAMDGIAAAC